MKRFKSMHVVLTCAVAVLALGLTACDQVGSAESDVVAQEASARAERSTEPIVALPGPPPFTELDGESTLVRTPNGISFRFPASGLTPGHAYTLWFVAFNAPGNCITPGCGPRDLLRPETMADMMTGTGRVVGGSGKATFSGHVRVGDTSGSAVATLGLPGVPGNGLTSPYGASIHLVIRDHGPMIAAYMPDMIHTLAGGCTNTGQGPAFDAFAASVDYADEFGRLGPNDNCSSVQLSMHNIIDV